ncbi:MAG: CTP synthetase [Halobacteriaceae archaeon]
MDVILVGPDRGLGDALRDAGATVTRVEGLATADALAEAGIADADLLVLTDPAEATAIPVALEANPDLRVVGYTAESLPEFAVRGLERSLDPALYDPGVVAEELVSGG